MFFLFFIKIIINRLIKNNEDTENSRDLNLAFEATMQDVSNLVAHDRTVRDSTLRNKPGR